MNENTLVNSFFFCFDVLLSLHFSLKSAFLFSKPFRNNSMHSLCNHWSLFQRIFCWKTLEKRIFEKCFKSVRVWAPKPVYRSPKWPGYIIVRVNPLLQSNNLLVMINSWFFRNEMSKNMKKNKHAMPYHIDVMFS